MDSTKLIEYWLIAVFVIGIILSIKSIVKTVRILRRKIKNANKRS